VSRNQLVINVFPLKIEDLKGTRTCTCIHVKETQIERNLIKLILIFQNR